MFCAVQDHLDVRSMIDRISRTRGGHHAFVEAVRENSDRVIMSANIVKLLFLLNYDNNRRRRPYTLLL